MKKERFSFINRKIILKILYLTEGRSVLKCENILKQKI